MLRPEKQAQKLPRERKKKEITEMPVLSGLVRVRLALAPRDASILVAASSAVNRRLYVALRGDWSPLSFEQVTPCALIFFFNLKLRI